MCMIRTEENANVDGHAFASPLYMLQGAVSVVTPALPGMTAAARAQQTSHAMRSALNSMVLEAEAMHRELFGREPPPDKVANLHFAVQQECAAVADNPDILCVRDTGFVWDRVKEHAIQPALAMALGAAALSETARPAHDLFESIRQATADMGPPLLLFEQFRLFESRMPGFWDRVQSQHLMRQQQDSSRQSAQALQQLAALSSGRDRPGAYSRPGFGFGSSFGPAGGSFAAAHPVFSVLRAVDAEWAAKPAEEKGCQYWSGLEGSCRRGEACADAASHTPNKPSAWYLARARVWQQHGGVRNPVNGNWTLPKLSGAKRPAAESGGGAFHPLG